MYRAIRGLVQTALEMRSYRRLRVKVFLRSDQINDKEVADSPDASRALSSMVELSWPRHELYGLLWHWLTNGPDGAKSSGSSCSQMTGRPVLSTDAR